jgi:hypothetical protein
VNPTISEKYMVTFSNTSGLTIFPHFKSSATVLKQNKPDEITDQMLIKNQGKIV